MPRFKISAEEAEAVYHCFSRIVNGERIIDELAREVFCRILRQVADYCGVHVITFAVLSNHFHILVLIARKGPVSDAELLRRYAVLYPKPTPYKAARLDCLRQMLAANGPEAEAWRRQQLALMNDVSAFMKLLKGRFSIWFNHTHDRFGTLWAERFGSQLIEPQSQALQTVCAYIDLNPVRAGLVTDPKDYRFCGYAEAVAGGSLARSGLHLAFAGTDWSETQAAYRQFLFAVGSADRENAATISPDSLRQVLASGGRLPLSTVLRCRLSFFTQGAILGSQIFVAGHLSAYRRHMRYKRASHSHSLPPITDWSHLAISRKPRLGGFG